MCVIKLLYFLNSNCHSLQLNCFLKVVESEFLSKERSDGTKSKVTFILRVCIEVALYFELKLAFVAIQLFSGGEI